MALVTLPSLGYNNPSGKANPKIAVNADNDLGVLTTKSVLDTAGVQQNKIQFSVVPFNDMITHRTRALAEAAAQGVTRDIVNRQAERFRDGLKAKLAADPEAFAKVLTNCQRYSQRKTAGTLG